MLSMSHSPSAMTAPPVMSLGYNSGGLTYLGFVSLSLAVPLRDLELLGRHQVSSINTKRKGTHSAQ